MCTPLLTYITSLQQLQGPWRCLLVSFFLWHPNQRRASVHATTSEAVAWQEAAQHNIQISFNTLMLNQPGEAALALAADLAQFAAAVAALENCSVRCSACGEALLSSTTLQCYPTKLIIASVAGMSSVSICMHYL